MSPPANERRCLAISSPERPCLGAGLVDEIVIHVAPVLLGDGVRLFERMDGQPIKLKPVDSAAAARRRCCATRREASPAQRE